MEMIGHLYKITRESTGEYYYGIHRGDRFDGYWGSGRIIKSYIKTHGVDDLTYEIIAIGSYADIIKLEEQIVTKEEISKDLCWNLKTGGYRGLLSEESRSLISKAGLGRKYSPERTGKIQESRKLRIKEIGQKISESNRGKKRTAEIRKRISDRKKELMTFETKQKLSKSKIGRSNPSWRGYVMTPDGIFESSLTAALYYGKTDKTIRDRIKSPNPRFDGWSFIKTPDPDYTIISTADIRGVHR